ncbi:hypothetical protein NFI96_026055 [Prochilodus magdalenae]|nr:hypothetical protein NFI96_026055 [Prochilodus magdalenae]
MDQTLALTLLLLLVFTPAKSHDPMEFHRERPEDFRVKEDDFTVSDLIEKANRNLGKALGDPTIEFGDIVVKDGLENADKCSSRNPGCKWPRKNDGKVYVPYIISNQYSSSERQTIKDALNSFEKVTCIRFRRRKREEDYIHIQSLGGCYSYVGRTGGKQDLSLDRYGCVYKNVIQHELLHALGFHHEQCRSDRDRHVYIAYENVWDGQQHNFDVEDTNNLGTPYDYGSVMHYERFAFSKNGQPTIIPIPDPNAEIGYATEMNNNDILRLGPYGSLTNVNDTVAKRQRTVLEGLPRFLWKNPSSLPKKCLDTDTEDHYTKDVKAAILTVMEDDVAASTSLPNVTNIAIILEEVVVLQDIVDLPTAFAYLFGLLFAINVEYPQELGYTFEAIQKIFMDLDFRVEEDNFTVSDLIERANRNLGKALGDPTIKFGDIVVEDGLENADKCAFRNPGCKWPRQNDGKVYVPYIISNQYSSNEKNVISDALNSFEKVTCIRFRRRTREEDYIHIQSLGGCYSYVGRTGGKQDLSLDRSGCVYKKVVQHELLHALGFHHEQCRSDRDRHVYIAYENVWNGQQHNFDVKDTNNLGTPYDYGSVMHYGKFAFSKNGQPTIIPIPDPNVSIGRATEMNNNDILRVNKLYCK